MATRHDVELKTGGKVAFGATCAVCCGLPMLLIAGVVTTGALFVGGVVIGAVSVVIVLAVLVGTRRLQASAPVVRLALFAAGGAGAVAGLWGLWDDRTGAAPIIAGAVAALACAALLTLADAQPSAAGA